MNFEPFRWELHYDWVNERMPMSWVHNTQGVVAVQDGAPKGCFLFNHWTFTGTFSHVLADTPMVWRHGLHREAFDYVFETCGKKYVFGITQGDNVKTLRLGRAFGYTEVSRIQDGYDEGIDLVVLRLTKEDWNERRSRAS